MFITFFACDMCGKQSNRPEGLLQTLDKPAWYRKIIFVRHGAIRYEMKLMHIGKDLKFYRLRYGGSRRSASLWSITMKMDICTDCGVGLIHAAENEAVRKCQKIILDDLPAI